MRLDSVLAVVGILTAIAAFYFPYRKSIRDDKANRLRQLEQDRQKAEHDVIAKAEQPLKDKIRELQAAEHDMVEAAIAAWRDRLADRDKDYAEMLADRNYWRDLANSRSERPQT